MKIEQILNEKQQLDEIPAGGLGQMAKKIGSKVLNKVPGATAKSKAANLAGKADLGDTANNLHKEFNQYLGTQDKTMAQATGEDLSAFLKTKKHKTAATIPSGVLQKKQLDNILMTVSKEAMSGQGGTTPAAGTEPNSSTPNDANNDGKDDTTGEPVQNEPAADAESKIEFVPNQEVMFISKGGKPVSAKVVGKSMDGDDSKVAVNSGKQDFNISREKLLDPKTKKPFKPGQAPSAAPSSPTPKPGDKVTYINAKGQKKQAEVNKLLKTKDAQGDPQIQLRANGAEFAVDQKAIQDINGVSTGQDAKPAAPSSSIPPEIQKQIDSLDDGQKKELASLL